MKRVQSRERACRHDEFGSNKQRPWAFLLLKVIIGSGIASIPGSMPLKTGCERSRSTCSSGGA